MHARRESHHVSKTYMTTFLVRVIPFPIAWVRMLRVQLAQWLNRARRVVASVVLCVLCCSAADAFALSEKATMFWGVHTLSPSVCLDTEAAALMGAPMLLMSTESEVASPVPGPSDTPCTREEKEEPGDTLCSSLDQAPEEAHQEQAPPRSRFVAASLSEDILPLDLPTHDPYSCSASSDEPDACESHPPFGRTLTLDAVSTGGVLSRAPLLSHPRDRARTLARIRPLPSSLIREARAHRLVPRPPPRG